MNSYMAVAVLRAKVDLRDNHAAEGFWLVSFSN